MGHQLSLEANIIHEHMIHALEDVFFRLQASGPDHFHKADGCSPGAGGYAACSVAFFVEDIRLKAFFSEKSIKLSASCACLGNRNFQDSQLLSKMAIHLSPAAFLHR